MNLIDPRDRKILIVDDDLDSLEIIGEALKWEGYEVQKASSGPEALQWIHKWHPDLVFLDVNMPGMDGVRILKELRNMDDYVSVIFISGDSSTESVIAGLDAGADDYVPKPFDPLELLARVRTQLRFKDLNDQLRQANARLKELVDKDDLTGLYNMRSIYERIQFELDRSKRFHRQVCVVMMDMDFFKSVNDGHDHLFGSFVLSEVGKMIRDTVRTIDIPARYGGDEFLIVLTETNKDRAYQFCERLRKSISHKLFKNVADEIKLTASLGFAITPPGDEITDPRTLVRLADNALYDAKRSGRNCVRHTDFVPSPAVDSKKAG